MCKISIYCDFCNKAFSIERYRILKNKNNFCSIKCHGEWKTESFIKQKEKELGISLEYWLKEQYITKNKSFRIISQELSINPRSVNKLLFKYNIPIRYGSDAVKTQWIDNIKRKEHNAIFMTNLSIGNTNRRLSFEERAKKLLKKNLNLLNVEYIDGVAFSYYICLLCGYKGKLSSSNLNYKGCPICKESKGERKIRLYLQENKINFERQYIFENCKYKTYLKFDFAIIYKNNVKLLIEYDGEQHFNPISFLGGTDEYEKLKLRDNIKNKFCIEQNIPLLRIPYNEFNNIENILDCEIYKSIYR